MTELEAVRLFKCLADRSRLQILKSLARKDGYVELLAQRLGLAPSTVSFHLKKLADAGAVTSYKSQYYTMYALSREMFELRIIDMLLEEQDEADKQAERERLWRRKVLDSFIDADGRLKTIPAQRKKRRIILERIAEEFDAGKTYAEREVNAVISGFHEDYATLRRELVDERIMSREDGIYRLEG